MKKETKIAISACLVVSTVVISSYIYESNKPSTLNENNNSNLEVSFIDVGQGDSIFIKLPNEETILIDAGVKNSAENIKKYITSQACYKIDYLVATHPHADHIGGMAYVINNFQIDNVYMPDADTTTKTYENLLETIADKNLNITTTSASDYIINSPDLSLLAVAPSTTDDDNLNNCSIVLKLRYKNNTFLFTGDAEKEELEKIYSDNKNADKQENYDISADVLKVGHHGSRTSTSEELLEAVNPKYAVISCGKDNDYGHPHKETINLLEKFNIKYYRTDIVGTVKITSDGSTLNITTTN